MHIEMFRDRTLSIAVILDSLGDLPISFLPVLQYTRRKHLVQSWPICITLTSRYVRDVLVPPQMIYQPVGERFCPSTHADIRLGCPASLPAVAR